jgi:hypothetical protein
MKLSSGTKFLLTVHIFGKVSLIVAAFPSYVSVISLHVFFVTTALEVYDLQHIILGILLWRTTQNKL